MGFFFFFFWGGGGGETIRKMKKNRGKPANRINLQVPWDLI